MRRFWLISIHALFAEGDESLPIIQEYGITFLSTPSSQRATPLCPRRSAPSRYFYPRPLRRGRRSAAECAAALPAISIHALFAEGDHDGDRIRPDVGISIHALFAEGDYQCPCCILGISDFYPRPLRRGRQPITISCTVSKLFLSTPSSQRATRSRRRYKDEYGISIHALFAEGDSTHRSITGSCNGISIHALFAEGDGRSLRSCTHPPAFLSTPSSQRATRTPSPARCAG